MERQFTIPEVLKATIEMLSTVAVPVSLTEQIAVPVARAIHNMRMCVEAQEKADQKASSQEPEFSIEPVEEKVDEG